ncbi:sugar nucleotide-binding protein [Neobacillus niacini]|uniref:sugar nucleotide-binding protein n=1 Tax=Neobacillus niacini TaxID=86668 RepID=UPI003983C0C8
MKKVLILGASGLVGRALIEEFKEVYDLYGTYSSTQPKLPSNKQFQLEVSQIHEMKEILRCIKPEIVISCLRGEFSQQLKFHKELAEELMNTSSSLYFFSTTNVFDGDFSKPHIESDHPNAESEYGKFKMDCEIMLKEALKDRAKIIRIPAIWGKDSPRWKMTLENIKNHKVMDVYRNLMCNNLLDVQLARQLAFIIENKLTGIFHLGSVDTMTQSQFYEDIFVKLGSDLNLLNSNDYLESDKTYYFAMQSTRNDIPKTLETTNKEIISYLLG